MSIKPDKPPLFIESWRSKLLIFLVLAGLVFPFFELRQGEVKAGFRESFLILEKEPEETPLVLQENSVLSPSPISAFLEEEPKRTLVIVTGYSSTPDQTDEDPWITASGKPVREGVIAANFLPLGTKVRLPALYGEKTFVVEDRMHPRMGYQVDIWFPSRWQALDFGVKTTHIEILES